MWSGLGIALVFLGFFIAVAIAAWFTARDLFRLTVELGAYAMVVIPCVYVMFELIGVLWVWGGYWATVLGLSLLLFAGIFAVVKWGN